MHLLVPVLHKEVEKLAANFRSSEHGMETKYSSIEQARADSEQESATVPES
jgi:hypothetical protein